MTESETKRNVYMGIDNGTQGLSIVLIDEASLERIATGEANYLMVPDLEAGCYEQRAEDWETAMISAMTQLREKLNFQVLAIGISGQMHGEVLMGENGDVLRPVRLWCDSRNEKEGNELTEALNHKVPKRMTSARFLWTIRNRPETAEKTRHITTPAGWMSYRLTQQHTLGIGDASGIFPVSQSTMTYDSTGIKIFDEIAKKSNFTRPLGDMLPRICVAGEPAGYLSAQGAKLLGLEEGIPIAPAEGDQPAALAGSLIGHAGTISLSFGTSVCANSVGDRQFQGVSRAVDQYCAADGKPINMVWLRNGTTFLNTVVGSYGSMLDSNESSFAAVMPQVVEASPDCGGLLALPFMEDEPGLQVSKGGSAMIVGWNDRNSTPGNVCKAALMSTIFNLRKGSEVLDEQGYPRTELVLTGGLTKTPECGQFVADIFNTPVTLLTSSDEGSSYGAGLLAAFLGMKLKGKLQKGEEDWPSFLSSVQKGSNSDAKRYEPIPSDVTATDAMYRRYQNLLALVQPLTDAVS